MLAAQYSQAELARRTGEVVTNVHRYLRGTRVPGRFLAALVRELGVNPAWLLSGHGPVHAADVSDSAASLASELLELLGAMGEVNRVRLGALDKGHHLALVRRLAQSLAEYERLRGRLSERSRDVMARLLDRLYGALNRRDMQAATDLRQAALMLRPLCDEPALDQQFRRMLAYYEYQCGHTLQATELQRETFLRYLPRGEVFTREACQDAMHLCSALGTLRRMAEVRRLANATIALAEGVGETWRPVLILRMLRASANADLGHLHEALRDASQALPLLDPADRAEQTARLTRILWLCGTMDLAGALNHGPASRLRSVTALKIALWDADVQGLRAALAECTGSGPGMAEPDSQEAVAVQGLVAALASPRRFRAASFLRAMDQASHYPLPAELAKFPAMALAAATLLRAGFEQHAAQCCLRGCKLLQDQPPGLEQEVMLAGLFWRTTARLDAAGHSPWRGSGEQARRWLSEKRAAGYLRFGAG
ncbi:MAG: helix-turn-helix transcriptional regulator [Planctomycetes bacterium]|nr:helix-turn-helix transcriptional regulator [Planctomycetota bacterium]MCL4731265.1 helix-turn-helix transcriptional regulator [Planctomycetota bacterium]